jgi:hypothetical protein
MADVNKEIGLRINIETAPTNAADTINAKVEKIGTSAQTAGKKAKAATSEMAAGFKSVEAQASALPGPIGQVANALGSVREGVSAFGGSLKSLRGAIASTGILALAVALASLYAYFTESEKGAQQFRVALGYLKGAFEAIVNVGEKIGETLVNAFRNPLQALKDLGNGIMSFLTNPTKAIGDIGRAIADIGKEARESANAFAEVARQLNALKVAERELNVERAMANKTIAEARLIADDINRSVDERIKAIRKAGAVESEVAAEEMRIAEARLAVIEQRLKVEGREESILDEQAQARARIYELERENIMRRKRLQTEEISLLREAAASKKASDEAEAERLKALAAEREKLWADEQARYKAHLTTLSDLKVENIESEEERERQAEILAFERKIAVIQGQGEMEMAIREQMQIALHNKLQAIDTKYRAQEKAATDLAAKQEIATAQMVAQAKWSAAQQSGNALIGIGKIVTAAMADNAEVAKGIATAEVWINAATATASAISKAVQSSVTPYDMIANIAVAVGTVAGAIASTIEILNKADIPGGGGGAAIGNMPSFTASAPQGAAVSTNVTGLVNTQQAELQPIQAFVVETAMTGTQSNIEQIYGQATFGLGG